MRSVSFGGFYTLGTRFDRQKLTEEYEAAVAQGQIPEIANPIREAEAKRNFLKQKLQGVQTEMGEALRQGLTEVAKETDKSVAVVADYEFATQDTYESGFNIVLEDQYDDAFERGVMDKLLQPDSADISLRKHKAGPIDAKTREGFVADLQSALRVGSIQNATTLEVLQAMFKNLIGRNTH